MGIIRRLSERIGAFEKLRYSKFYPLYDRIFNPQNEAVRRREMAFYHQLFAYRKPPGIIFDVGANSGFKTRVFSRLGFHVVALEPEKVNAVILRKDFRKAENVIVVQKAVSSQAGFAELNVVENGSAYNTLERDWLASMNLQPVSTYQVETVTLDELIKEFGSPFFIKIDVEGHEEKVLGGLHHPVQLISFESALKYRSDTIRCINFLSEISSNYQFGLSNDLNYGKISWWDATDFKKQVSASSEVYFEVFASLLRR